eukprot:13125295-Alexandrium_andersonii.AAC.1
MTASTSSGSTGGSCPGCTAGPASTDSISGAQGTDCELTGALDPPWGGAARHDAGTLRSTAPLIDWD